jgi:hypothetical protein
MHNPATDSLRLLPRHWFPSVQFSRAFRLIGTTSLFLFLSLWFIYGFLINSDNLKAFGLQQMGVEAIGERGHFYLEGSKSAQLRPLGDTFSHGGHIYAAKQPGQFMAGAIVYFFLHKLGLNYVQHYLLTAALVTFLTTSALTALAAVAVFRIARDLADEPSSIRWPLITALIFGLATTVLPYSGIAHHDAIATAYLVLAVYLVSRLWRANLPPRASAWAAGGVGLLLGVTVTTSMLPFPMVLVVGVFFISLGKWKLLPPFVAGAIAGLVPLLLYDGISFGNPFLLPNVAGKYSDTYFHLNWSNFTDKLQFYARFITLYVPVFWLGLAGLICLWRKHPRETWLFLALILVLSFYILNIDSVGTCNYGPRYLLPAMPFAAIGIIGFRHVRLKSLRFALSGLVIAVSLYSMFVNVVGAVHGAMYCDLARFALVPYLHAMTHGQMRSFPLAAWLFFPAILCYVPALKKLSESRFAVTVSLLAAIFFYFSTRADHGIFDYTHRIAQAFLSGHVGLFGSPGRWLAELVPVGKEYYSVFPLGAVLVNIPTAILQKMGLVRSWPARELAAVLAGGCVYFFYRLSHVAEMSRARRVLVSLFPIFATWSWCNLGFAGAWQMALGFALLGQAACLYYTLVRRNPLLAGVWFAIAFGNRTELILTLPVYIYFWLSPLARSPGVDSLPTWTESICGRLGALRPRLMDLGLFLSIPAILLLFTAAYNLVRFGSVADFGYARIPGVLNEPWYRYGLFSFHYIRWNSYEMLFRGMIDMQEFPYLRPIPFGCSIFIASPFLFLLFREGGKHRTLCWIVIAVLTLFLWCHGNTGGWQFSYRYGMILLPWMFVLIVENGGRKITTSEAALFIVSAAVNAIAVYEFLWAKIIHV